MNEGPGHFAAGFAKDPVEGLAGDPHAFCRVGMVEALAAREAHGFQFIGGEDDFFEVAERDAGRLEICGRRRVQNSAGAEWTGHLEKELTVGNMSICSFLMSVKVETKPGGGTMKIAIPMADGKFSEHFGGAKEFLIYQVDGKPATAGVGELHFAPEHKPGSLPEWLAAQKVDAVIVSAIGERALLMLADAGIETYLSGGEANPSALVAACLLGKLPRANQENSRCNGSHHDHDGHDCGHH